MSVAGLITRSGTMRRAVSLITPLPTVDGFMACFIAQLAMQMMTATIKPTIVRILLVSCGREAGMGLAVRHLICLQERGRMSRSGC